MIFITVGTHPQQFNRLLAEVDRLIEKGRIKVKVFAQSGYSTYRPKNYSWENFLTDEDYNGKIKAADIIITHSGAGSIITALSQRKKLIIVPRLSKFGEHTNDHQIDLARKIKEKNLGEAVFDVSDLEKAIKGAKAKNIKSTKKRLITEIRNFLNYELS